MWRVDSLGVSSKDFMNKDNQNSPGAFNGTMWRFADDKTQKAQSLEQNTTNPYQGPQPAQKATPLGILNERRQWDVSKAQDIANSDTSKKVGNTAPLDNHLVDEARAMGHPISQPDTGWTQQHADDQKAADAVLANNETIISPPAPPQAEAMSKSKLMKMGHEVLKEMAAGVGVTNLDQKKEDLADAILAKQA